MNDIFEVVQSHITNVKIALSFALVNKSSYSKYIKNITKMRKFMSKFVSKGNYVNHIIKMNNTRGNKLSKQDAINSAIIHFKQLTFCQQCWLDNTECYCCEEWFNYLKPETSYICYAKFANVAQ